MKTPEEIMRRVLSAQNVSGREAQVYIVADQVKALDAAGYVIVPKGEDTLSPEKAEEIAKEATTQLQGRPNIRVNPSWNLGPLKR